VAMASDPRRDPRSARQSAVRSTAHSDVPCLVSTRRLSWGFQRSSLHRRGSVKSTPARYRLASASWLRPTFAEGRSRSVFVVSHHLDGFLRHGTCGFVAPRCRSWDSPCSDHLSDLTARATITHDAPPFGVFPSPSAARSSWVLPSYRSPSKESAISGYCSDDESVAGLACCHTRQFDTPMGFSDSFRRPPATRRWCTSRYRKPRRIRRSGSDRDNPTKVPVHPKTNQPGPKVRPGSTIRSRALPPTSGSPGPWRTT